MNIPKETEAPLLQSAQGDFSGIWEQIAPNLNRRLRLSYGEASAIHLYRRYQVATVIYFSIPAEKFES